MVFVKETPGARYVRGFLGEASRCPDGLGKQTLKVVDSVEDPLPLRRIVGLLGPLPSAIDKGLLCHGSLAGLGLDALEVASSRLLFEVRQRLLLPQT
jgi:hypothetical protein